MRKNLSLLLTTTSTTVLSLMSSLVASDALAACIESPAGSGSYTCSNTTGSPIGLSGPMLDVRADSSFQAATTAIGAAALSLNVTAGGTDLTMSQDALSTISGGYYGINALNSGSGSSTITTAGTVTGTNNAGIDAENGSFNVPSGTNLTVTQTGGTISGGNYGIRASNFGTGSTTVTTAGTVTGTKGGPGISVQNASSGTDVSVTQTDGEVTGYYDGIDAYNSGTGSLTVTTAGTVTGGKGSGTIGAGINAQNLASTTTNLTVTQTGGTIMGAGSGISAQNFSSTGSMTVTTAGSVTGGGIGIDAQSWSFSDTDLTVTQNGGTILGGVYGIYALNVGTGSTTVTTGGTVTGTSRSGIYVMTLQTDATVDIAGHVRGGNGTAIDMSNVGGGTGDAALVLRSGWALTGQALGTSGANDTLVLAGVANAGLDLSQVGDASNTNAILDFEHLIKRDAGVWDLTGAQQAGGFATASIDGGALWLNNASLLMESPASEVTVTPAGTLYATGNSTILGALANAGVVSLSGMNATPGTTLTVSNYIGNGGTIALRTYLGADGSASDRLVIDGGTASGRSTLAIVNASGPGAQTTADGIRVVDAINGATTSSTAFHLNAPVVAGAFEYGLYYGGIGADANDQDWYLRSDGLNASAQTARPYADILANYAYATLGTLQQRTGNRIWPNGTSPALPDNDARISPTLYGAGIWGRIVGQYSSYENGSHYNQGIGFLQAGDEGTAFENAYGELTAGLYATLGTSKADIELTSDPVTGAARKSTVATNGYGLGANATWLGNEGLYADAIGQLTWYDSNLSNEAGSNNQGWSSVLSMEVGQRFNLGSGWAIVPQAQLAWTQVDFDSFTDIYGARISLSDGDSLKGRAGLRLEKIDSWKGDDDQTRRVQLFGIANLSSEFLGSSKIDVSGVGLQQSNDGLWGEVGLGGTYAWNDKWSAYGDASYATALGATGSSGNYTLKGTVGVGYRW